jgi:transposase
VRGSAKAADFVNTLRHLRRHVKGPVFFLWDGLPGHRSGEVRRYCEKNRSWLSVFRFPAYAPELNPVEYLWSSSKRKDFGNAIVRKPQDIPERIRKSTARVRRKPDVLLGFMEKAGLFKNLC